ncbi:hypothetical protein A6F68_00106 [Tsuneonella dongtanensis]|uniref:Uncharacterized protein n=1 Tax=Tsuneonella dongtanensis TaxID=692370 RepID=A0A1B2A934_9SPHN|nr:hypothetical protein A6F68_00106 [Tsuneonella dongtanensis]
MRGNARLWATADREGRSGSYHGAVKGYDSVWQKAVSKAAFSQHVEHST